MQQNRRFGPISGLLAVVVVAGCGPQPNKHVTDVEAVVPEEMVRSVGLVRPLDFSHFNARSASYIRHIECSRPDRARFVCSADRSRAIPAVEGCTFQWSLRQVRDASGPVAITGRLSVLQPAFRDGGVSKFRKSRAGVAVVACRDGRRLKVSFAISSAREVASHASLFRTIGFDWTSRRHDAGNLYELETFALASLLRISDRVARDGRRVSGSGTVIDRGQAKAANRLFRRGTMIRVGNNSDEGLGLSRGACLLSARAANLSVRHVAPSATIAAYHGTTPSYVFETPQGLISAPCPPVMARLSIQPRRASRLPAVYSSKKVVHRNDGGASAPALDRETINMRAVGLSLYLLGFDVREPTRPPPGVDGAPSSLRVQGMWPREEILASGRPAWLRGLQARPF